MSACSLASLGVRGLQAGCSAPCVMHAAWLQRAARSAGGGAAHWRSKLIRLPLPYGLVIDAWKARAGASFERTLSHAAVTWRAVEGGGGEEVRR